MEAVRTLVRGPGIDIRSYQYLGLGGIHFVDFRMVHREFGIDNMTSFEKDRDHKSRFRFNRPYGCVDLIFQRSHEGLATVSWSSPTILWLDYDGMIDKDKLNDVSTFLASAPSGSLLFVTLNVRPEVDPTRLALGEEEVKEKALTQFKRRVGAENVPSDVDPEELIKDQPSVAYRILDEHVSTKIEDLNGSRSDDSQRRFDQLIHLSYSDDADMLLWGGVLSDKEEVEDLASCPFEEMEFYSPGNEPEDIVVPSLTKRERRWLRSQLPSPAGEGVDQDLIQERDVERFERIYRFFPEFIEARI